MENQCSDLELAPRDGFEPSTNRLTAGCSTAELPGSKGENDAKLGYNKGGTDCKGIIRSAACRRIRTTSVMPDPWRPRPELNRGTRFCRPLRNHSATWPHSADT
jgi:hypothetical protein